MGRSKSNQIDLTLAFKGINQYEQKLKTVASWLSAYFKDFTKSKHGQDWNYKEEKDSLSHYQAFLTAKNREQQDRVYTEIEIKFDGTVRLSQELIYEGNTLENPDRQNIDDQFQIDMYSAPDAFAKVINVIRTSYYDDLTQDMGAFNKERIALLNRDDGSFCDIKPA
jgi:hypothetical protein